MRAVKFSMLASAASYADAALLLRKPGDCAVVERSGIQRQLVMRCPDGCSEVLSINLDPRSGRAWRLQHRRGKWSLFPSIDKPSGCLSHFILWAGQILWCDRIGGGEEPELYMALADRVLDQFG